MTYSKGKSKGGNGIAAVIEKIGRGLSIEIKVAIAVATGFVLMVVGAMAQGSERSRYLGFRSLFAFKSNAFILPPRRIS